MDKFLKKYDLLSSFCISVLFVMFIIYKIFGLEINYAIINFFFSILFPIYFIMFVPNKTSKTNILLVVVLMTICKIVSMLLNFTDVGIFLNNFVDVITFFIFAISFYKMISASTKEKISYVIKYTLNTIVIFSVIFCIYNLIANSYQFSFFLNERLRNFISFSSFFENRNTFAQLMFFSVIICVYLKKFVYFNNHRKLNWLTFCMILFMINIVLTLSRTGILSIVLFLFLYLMWNKKINKPGVIFLGILIIVLLFNYTDIFYYLKSFVIRSDTGLSGRNLNWEAGLQMINNKPIFGFSVAGSTVVLNSLMGNSYFHNTYIKAFANNGIIYVILLVYLIAKNYVNISKINNCEKRMFYYSAMVCILLYGLMEDFAFFGFGLIEVILTIIFFIMPNIDFIKEDGYEK